MVWSGFLSIVVFAVLSATVLWQSRNVVRGLRRALREGPESFRGDYTPPACIVLCLKGSDPFLDRCLEALAHQDYPDYRLMVVVDSAQDEAIPHVERARQAFGKDRVEVVIRDVDLPTCSRKCNNMLSAYRRISDRIEVVATCDGDAVAHPSWLRELVFPMRDPKVLATTGNRWYSPPAGDGAAFVRYCWNSIAVSEMANFHIPWGGSLALRSEVFRDPLYLELLSEAFGEDTQLSRYLETRNTHIVSVLPLVMLNEEGTTFRSLWGFLERQMLSARLHHWAWPLILAEALTILFALCILPVIAAFGGLENLLLGWLAPAVGYLAAVSFHTARYEWLVRKSQKAWHGRTLPPMTVSRIVATTVAMACTGFLYSAAILRAAVAREHVWRGVRYRFQNGRLSVDGPTAAVATVLSDAA